MIGGGLLAEGLMKRKKRIEREREKEMVLTFMREKQREGALAFVFISALLTFLLVLHECME